MARDTNDKRWWDGEWNTLEAAVRAVARDEMDVVMRERNLAAINASLTSPFDKQPPVERDHRSAVHPDSTLIIDWIESELEVTLDGTQQVWIDWLFKGQGVNHLRAERERLKRRPI